MAYDKVVDSGKLDSAIKATADQIRNITKQSVEFTWDSELGFNSPLTEVYERVYDVDTMVIRRYIPEFPVHVLTNYGCSWIGPYAFAGVRFDNRNIEIPSGVADINGYAFRDSVFDTISFPDTLVNIMDGAFERSSITSVTIPSGCSLGFYAFRGCKSLASVSLPSGITELPQWCFDGCSALASIEIPDSVTSIGDSVFNNCTALTHIWYGGTPEQWAALENTPTAGVVYYYSESVPDFTTGFSYWHYVNGEIVIWAESEGLAYTLSNDGTYYSVSGIGDCTDTNIVIPSRYEELPVKEIGYDSFGDNIFLTSIAIPDSVTSIGAYAFNNCTGLTNVIIPDSVTSIEYSAFNNCTSLTNVTLPDGIVSIGGNAFYNTGYYNNSNNWVDGVLYIGNYLIKAQETVAGDYSIKDGTAIIAEFAFQNCTSLTSVTIPDSVNSIGDNSIFTYCTSLTSITVDEGNTVYKSSEDGVLFTKDGSTLITYPAGKLETSYITPDSVISIGTYAFSGCTSLTSVIIGNSVIAIKSFVFSDCTNLAEVTIGNGVNSIGQEIFFNCTSLTSITVDENNTAYKSIDGVLFTKDGSVLRRYPSIKTNTSYTIPDSVTSIGDNAFENCVNLTNVIIPDSVTSIGAYAFVDCVNLTNVTIPDSVTSIRLYAFQNCINLTSVTIPNSITSIESGVFNICTGLTDITIPDSITSIAWNAFASCTALTHIYYKGTPEQWSALSNTPEYGDVYYYSESTPDFTTGYSYWHYVDGEIVIWAETTA